VEQSGTIDARVTAVRGAVLDVAFDGVRLPPIDDALVITPDKGAPIIAEVQSHLDEATVRALALQSTAGLRRGGVAHATGGPCQTASKTGPRIGIEKDPLTGVGAGLSR
jgi:F-type H+-transporting ATPase subunit beta